jgi:hypothetical protein
MDTTNSINLPFDALMTNWDTLSQIAVGQKIEINGPNMADGSGTVAISWGSNQSYTAYAIQSSFRSLNQYMYSTLTDTAKTALWLDAFSDKTVTYIETELNQADSSKLFKLFQSMINGCQALEKLKETYQSERDLKSAETLDSLSQWLKEKTDLLQGKLTDKATQFYNSFSIEDMEQVLPWIDNNIELIGFKHALIKKNNSQNRNSDFDQKATDEFNQFQRILDELESIERIQNEALNRRKAEEAKPKASIAATYNDQVQNYESVLQSENYEGYKLYSNYGAGWTQFDAQEKISRREKFYISLTRDQTNIARAFFCVAPILKKYNIASFQTLKFTDMNNIGINADGKELVIFIQKNENNQELWSLKILPEILSKFKSMNIQCGNPSKGGVSVAGGEGFIYTRSSDNCFDIYMDAVQLEKFGFSAFESANISRYPWSNIRINNAQPIQEKKIRLEAKHEIIKHVPPQQVNAVKEVFDQLFNDTSFFQMIVGNEPEYLPPDCSTGRDLVEKYGTNIGNFGADKVYKVIGSAKLKREMFDHYFQVAAHVTAQLRHYYGIETPVGNIRPALYEHFIRDHKAPINHEKNIAIVKGLVLCALRNGAVVPAQPVQVDEKLLKGLIEKAIASHNLI